MIYSYTEEKSYTMLEGTEEVRKLIRGVVALVALGEALAFFVGAGLHLGIPMPGPFIEPTYLPSAVLEAASGVFLGIAAAVVLAHKRQAWKLAVAAHVAGVASIAFGIASRGSAAAHSGHHPTMLLTLIVALIGLSMPPVRHALESGRRHTRRRRRILQAL
jgi:hypothetical protein